MDEALLKSYDKAPPSFFFISHFPLLLQTFQDESNRRGSNLIFEAWWTMKVSFEE